MDEAAVVAEAEVGDTKAAVEAGTTTEAAEARIITMIEALMRPRRVTVLWHLHRPQKGTYLQRRAQFPILRQVRPLGAKVDRMGTGLAQTALN
jgi:hypothetical protein